MIFIQSLILLAAAKVVVELELDTLQPTLDEHEVVLVTFYANWCPYSVQFYEPYEEIAAEASAKYPSMTFAQFDCGKS